MNSVKNSVKIFSFATLLSIVLSSCSGTPPIVPSNSPQIIPYSESRMAEFSKELSETSEIYIESNNGLRKTVIDLQSGNSYDETTENGTLNKTYFLNQSEGTVPVGVYRLFEKDQLHCYYPIEGDATIDLYKLLIDSNDAKKHNVQVNYDGSNRVETIHYGEDTKIVVFWGDTTIPLSIGRKNDMENFVINLNVISNQIPNAEMQSSLESGLSGYSLYIPPNPYA